MTIRKKIVSVFRRTNTDGIPFGAYDFLLPRGYTERRIREKGCGIFHFEKPYLAEMKGVEVFVKEGVENGRPFVVRRFLTSVGSVEERVLVESEYGSQRTKEFLIKIPKDYETIQYIVEKTVYHINYDLLQRAERDLGEDGVVLANVDRTPFQKLLLEWVGPERLFVDLFEIPEKVEELLCLMMMRAEEVYRIAANSPADIVHTWDNITEDFVTPRLFEKYCLSFYQKVGTFLHEKGKIFVVHMDGKLQNIKELIAQTPVDVIESFSLPGTGGNLSIEEAQKVWPDKAIIANLPAWLCFQTREFIEEYLEELIQHVDRKRFMLCVSEDLPRDRWQETLDIVACVLSGKDVEGDSFF